MLWLVISVIVIAIALVMEKVLQLPLAQITQDWIATPGLSAALAILLLLSLDLCFPVPSSLIMTLSGVVFGVVEGGVLSLLGSLAGNFAGFALARKYGIDLSQRVVGAEELRKMDHLFRHYGPLIIILSRPIPVMMETLSLVAGLSTMKRRTFLLASLLGTMPVCFGYAAVGAFSLQFGTMIPILLIGIGVPVGLWAALHAKLHQSI
jgi:uncharacterized membrane protein YdjX (TVP38/TMEM64 family)